MPWLKNIFKQTDWLLFGVVFFIAFSGLITMNSFISENKFFEKQSIWIILSTVVFFIASAVDWRFLRKKTPILIFYFLSIAVLLLLFIVGSVFKGAQSWFDLGGFSFQPTDLAKISLVLLLAKYFARRHVEIAHFRHIIVSGSYAFLVFVLVLLQPDFGSAIIIFLIWFGMVLVSGISKKHLIMVLLLGAATFASMWLFVFQDYQKQRIVTFIHPLADIQGAGYNAYQSTIAVGSGQIFGKGIGMGSQSKLKFLPEYETDFIFAAFAEEWGFVGAATLFLIYGILIFRIIAISSRGETNFESLYGLGLATIFLSHFFIHVGMNIGLLPVTGIVLPLMSYGGSHLLAEFLGLGILAGMSKYARDTHKEEIKNELLGVADFQINYKTSE